jgi:outer membrane receptor protein involved in Fe transport
MIGFNYNLSRDWGFYFNYAEGFRAPAFLELTCSGPGSICPGLQAGVAPDPPLRAVTARNYEVGLRARPTPWLDTELALYRTDVFDDIYSVSPTGTTGVSSRTWVTRGGRASRSHSASDRSRISRPG